MPEYLLTERRQRDGGAAAARVGGMRWRTRRRLRGCARSRALRRRPGQHAVSLPGARRLAAGTTAAIGPIGDFRRGGDRPPFRPAPRPAPRPSGDEPWSEVPPEIEAMLRAQQGSRPRATSGERVRLRVGSGQPRSRSTRDQCGDAAEAPAIEAEAPSAGRATRGSGRTTAEPAHRAPLAAAVPLRNRSPRRRETRHRESSSSTTRRRTTPQASGTKPSHPGGDVSRALDAHDEGGDSRRRRRAGCGAAQGEDADVDRSDRRHDAKSRQHRTGVAVPEAGGDPPAEVRRCRAQARSPRKKAEPTA